MSRSAVLLTGFEPFAGAIVNPSALVVAALHGREIAGRGIEGVVLPVVFGTALHALRAHLHRVDPELVIAVGQAGGRAEIALERVAINIDDARIPDNVGAQPIDRPIDPEGPAAYWSTLPIKATVGALQARGIPAAVSQTAGTFVCNHVFYGLMRALAGQDRVRGGFVHLPFLPEQAADGEPSLPLERMVAALEVAVETALHTRVDRRIAGGATH